MQVTYVQRTDVKAEQQWLQAQVHYHQQTRYLLALQALYELGRRAAIVSVAGYEVACGESRQVLALGLYVQA
jgi:hypothetical protein